MMNLSFARVLLIVCALVLAACGGSDDGDAVSASTAGAAPETEESGLTPEQMEKGIGPITHVELAATVEQDLADHGEEIFKMKCSACHKMDQRYVGPPLGDVVERRAPEYVMNMILNTQEMIQNHPEAKALLAKFMTPMPNQSLTQDEARAVLEYLREQHQELAASE